MINRLRKKFIVAAIVAVFLVLALLIGAINVFNYRSLVSDADATLQILADNKGSFPRQMFREQNRPSGMQLPPDEGGGRPRLWPARRHRGAGLSVPLLHGQL